MSNQQNQQVQLITPSQPVVTPTMNLQPNSQQVQLVPYQPAQMAQAQVQAPQGYPQTQSPPSLPVQQLTYAQTLETQPGQIPMVGQGSIPSAAQMEAYYNQALQSVSLTTPSAYPIPAQQLQTNRPPQAYSAPTYQPTLIPQVNYPLPSYQPISQSAQNNQAQLPANYSQALMNSYNNGNQVRSQSQSGARNLPKASSEGFASAAELEQAFNLPIQQVAELLNESHTKLEDAALRQEQAIVEYSKHFVNHQNFIKELIPHVDRYEQLEIRHDKMEELLTNPVELQKYFAELVRLEREGQGQGQQQLPPAQQQGAPREQLYNVKLSDGRTVQMTASQLQQAQARQQQRQAQGQLPALPPAGQTTASQQPQRAVLPSGQAQMYGQVEGNSSSLDNIRPDQRWQYMDSLEKAGKIGVRRGASYSA